MGVGWYGDVDRGHVHGPELMGRLPTPGGSDVWGADLNAAILGLVNQADYLPASPSAYDDEFDGSSGVSWTTTPTAPNAYDVNSTAPGCAYVRASGSSAAMVGKYQAIPGSYPFTITARVSSTARANYHRGGGIFIAPATPTGSSNLLYLGHLFHTTYGTRNVQRTIQSFAGSAVSNTGQTLLANNCWGPLYLRLVANSATSVTSQASLDGKAWFTVESAANPGFTPGVMGFSCNEEGSAVGVEAFFDFFRVT